MSGNVEVTGEAMIVDSGHVEMSGTEGRQFYFSIVENAPHYSPDQNSDAIRVT
jgi:hypothetical protein